MDGGTTLMIERSRPAYEQVADAIRDDIKAGHDADGRSYEPGVQLPSERELRLRFDVSSNTVKVAMATLRAEGLITSRQNQPPIVTENVPLIWQDTLVTRADGFYTMLERANRTPATKTTVTRGPCPEDAADVLGIETGDEVVIRHRLMRAEGGPPLCIAVSYFPQWVIEQAPNLADPDMHGQPTWLRNAFGPTWAQDVCAARTITEQEAEALQAAPGSAVATRKGRTYDREGRTLTYIDVVTPEDRLPASFTIGPVPDDEGEAAQ